MNLINKITESSAIFDKVAFRYAVYFYLISDVSAAEDELYSNVAREDVYLKFRKIKQDIVENAIEKLIAEKLIESVAFGSDEWLMVGIIVDGVNKLFSVEGEPEDIFKPVNDAIENYFSEASGYVKAKARIVKTKFQNLQNKKISEYVHYDFVAFFKVCYEAFFQEDAREFMKKEHGMLKSLINSYDSVTVCKMIIYYFMHSEKYGKAPSLGILLYKRDEVYMHMKGKNKPVRSKTGMRTKLDKEEF